MHVVALGVGEQPQGDVVRGRSVTDQRDTPRLAFVYCPNVAAKYLFEIGYGLAVASMYECRRQRPDAGKADEVFTERRVAFVRVDRIGRKDRIRRDAFKHAVAADDRSVGLADE